MTYKLHHPGEVVWANVFNPFENHFSTGKPRPSVLVAREYGHWWLMGLTTNETFRDGSPRPAIPNPTAVGLTKSGYLCGDRLTRVSAIDIGDHIGDHIGYADAALAELIIWFTGIHGWWAENLRDDHGFGEAA